MILVGRISGLGWSGVLFFGLELWDNPNAKDLPRSHKGYWKTGFLVASSRSTLPSYAIATLQQARHPPLSIFKTAPSLAPT